MKIPLITASASHRLAAHRFAAQRPATSNSDPPAESLRQHYSTWGTWPSPYASAGMLISNTSTRGRVYGMSVEHHVSNEMIVQNASDWHFYALQFEEEREEGPRTLPLLIENSSNLLFANTFFYRVVSSFVPQPYTIGMYSSSNVHLRNVHVYSNSKVSFDNSVFEVGTQQNVRDPDFALLDVMEGASVISEAPGTNVLMSGRKVKQLADGFFDISGVAVDSVGDLYFADPRKFQLYRWSVAEEQIEELCKIADRPEQLAFDKTGNLLIVAYEGNGTVFSWNPEEPDTPPRRLDAQPAQDRPGLVAVLPVNRWMGAPQFISDSTRRRPFHFVSPDGSTFIPAGGDFAMGTVSWGTKLCDLLRAFRLAPAESGKRFYVCNEAELQTWSFAVNLDGTLSDPQLFVEEGGESVVVDETGRVYIAAGQVRVFGPAGQLIENLEVPQKPTCLAIGGTEKRTLFIAARSALYSVDIQ